jgi:hypothetical protein
MAYVIIAIIIPRVITLEIPQNSRKYSPAIAETLDAIVFFPSPVAEIARLGYT